MNDNRKKEGEKKILKFIKKRGKGKEKDINHNN